MQLAVQEVRRAPQLAVLAKETSDVATKKGFVPAALDASLEAASRVDEQRRQVIRDWERRVERARYEADRAGRQYQACEPENRLVARELERRWEETLKQKQRLDDEYDRFQRSAPADRNWATRVSP